MARRIPTKHDEESLHNVTVRIAESAKSLMTVVEQMKTHGIKTLSIVNQDSLMRGLSAVEDFSFRAKESLNARLEVNGHFQAGPKQVKPE